MRSLHIVSGEDYSSPDTFEKPASQISSAPFRSTRDPAELVLAMGLACPVASFASVATLTVVKCLGTLQGNASPVQGERMRPVNSIHPTALFRSREDRNGPEMSPIVMAMWQIMKRLNEQLYHTRGRGIGITQGRMNLEAGITVVETSDQHYLESEQSRSVPHLMRPRKGI
ncbi:uncharacterized protein EI90DRAFT_2529819 [Cantharellus anzutake]|uniref:uncharacterized protein n=1 Tax=Cantharellus anzutake TaxID=1750568 RepID=UPI0019058EEE|nr:uncharacterized protein EI90DRAFT_2529819 [Cantharellus anzutake]KAF8338008.1 hypothetical protein EI90DRAFT_2529819 [Cantharellus anzutake]